MTGNFDVEIRGITFTVGFTTDDGYPDYWEYEYAFPDGCEVDFLDFLLGNPKDSAELDRQAAEAIPEYIMEAPF